MNFEGSEDKLERILEDADTFWYGELPPHQIEYFKGRIDGLKKRLLSRDNEIGILNSELELSRRHNDDLIRNIKEKERRLSTCTCPRTYSSRLDRS